MRYASVLLLTLVVGCSGVTVQKLADRNFELASRPSSAQTFTVPENTLALQLVLSDIEDTSTGVYLAPFQFDAPNERLYNLRNPKESIRTLIRHGIWSGLINTPQRPVTPGNYKLVSIRDWGQTTANLKVFAKVGKELPKKGVLDLRFYFMGAPAKITAEIAKNHPSMKTALGVVKRFYSQAGIKIGQVEYIDVKGLAGERFRRVRVSQGRDNELNQMFRLATHDSQKPALNFFIVEYLQGSQPGFTLLGISGGIPGPPGIDTPYSGVAVGMNYFFHSPQKMGMIMAHEGGHYLGLYHTTEQSGTRHDNLADTLECRPNRDRNFNGRVTANECDGSGNTNLMFWEASSKPNHLSPEQGRIMRSNMLVRHED